jgi:hypothetical protein
VETISGVVEPDDILIMCSDGLTRYLDDEQLIRLSRLRDPRDSVRRMINETNQRGGADNVSVAVIRVGEAVAESDISKHVQKLVVPVAIDTQPMITPDVDTKPNTNIPLSRPEAIVADTVSNPIPKVPEPSRQTKKQPPIQTDSRRNVTIGIAVAVLAVGALFFFGALFFLTQDGRASSSTPTSALESPILTENPESTQVNDSTIGVGDAVRVADSIPTLVRVGETVGSFVTAPNTPYLIQEIFEDSEGQLWYRLLDEESHQTGWIAARDVTSAQ